MASLLSSQAFAQKVVVAHRGASGYLPEHTLEAKAMAYAMGADYIEQDVVMTKDDELIVIHDITLDRTTDVAVKFPGRARADGRHYAIDFTLAEIHTLALSEGAYMVDGERQQGYKSRFPMDKSNFRIATLAEEIELIQGLNVSTGKDIGIYPEIKSPEFHLAEGHDLGRAVVATLKAYGYTSKQDKVFLQTFGWDEVKRLRDELLPEAGIDLKLVMLVGDDEEYQWMFNAEGMAEVARYADGFGPEKGLIIDPESKPGALKLSELVELAHSNGMQVHPYTFRADEGQVPAWADSFEAMLEAFLFEANIDGVFTDFPDRAVDFLRGR
jgi:glycerophosphoryl diester phosphodiesterase